MDTEYYYEVWRSKRFSSASEYGTLEFDSMDIMKAKSAAEALKEINKRIDAANIVAKDSLCRYVARDLREI
jgi:hypothetical protein